MATWQNKSVESVVCFKENQRSCIVNTRLNSSLFFRSVIVLWYYIFIYSNTMTETICAKFVSKKIKKVRWQHPAAFGRPNPEYFVAGSWDDEV